MLLPHDDAVKVEGASVGEKWAVIATRSRAQQTLVSYALPAGGAIPQELGEGNKVVFDEPAYTLSGGRCWWLRGVLVVVVVGGEAGGIHFQHSSYMIFMLLVTEGDVSRQLAYRLVAQCPQLPEHPQQCLHH